MVLNAMKRKLQGSVLEPVVAIIILVVTIGMALTVMTRTNAAIPVKAINKANEMIEREMSATLETSDFLSNEITDGAFHLVKKVQFSEETGLIDILLQVFDVNGKLIADKNRMIIEYNKETSVNETDR